MSQRPRIVVPGHSLHVVNRGNDRKTIFQDHGDYQRFLDLLSGGRQRYPVQITGYCLMPNHFHLVLRPDEAHALSAYMHWVTRGYSCDLRFQTRTRGNGHVFQRRYWSRVILGDGHYICVLRYVEANPVRAALVTRAEAWRWSSLWERESNGRRLLDTSPVNLPVGWTLIVNTTQQEADVAVARGRIARGRPRRLREP